MNPKKVGYPGLRYTLNPTYYEPRSKKSRVFLWVAGHLRSRTSDGKKLNTEIKGLGGRVWVRV